MSIAEQVLSHQPSHEGAQSAQTETEVNGLDSILAQLDGGEVLPKSEEKLPEEIPEEKTDPRLSLIAKMERKIKMQEQELKRREQEMEERLAKLKGWEELENEQDPLKLMGKKGWDLEKINKYAMENLGEEDLDPVAKRFKEFEEKLSLKDKEWEEKLNAKIAEKEKEIQQREYDAQIAQFKGEIKSLLAAGKDEFELVNAEENGVEIVYDVIYADLQNQIKQGRKHEELVPMDAKLAATRVEQYLDSQVQRYLNLNKYKSRTAPKDEDELANILGKSQAPRTLDSSFVPKSRPVDQLSDKEREEAAIELLKRGF
jgi:hypothetical protein